jgi:HK97 family phage major capsid protein
MDPKDKTGKITLSQAIELAKEAALEARGATSAEVKNAIFEAKFAGMPHKSAEGKQKIVDFINFLGQKAGFIEVTDKGAFDAIEKDLSTLVSADGGVLVPTELRTALIERKYRTPRLRNYATTLPMPNGKLDLDAESTTVTVNWITELATITQSDPQFTKLSLSAKSLMGLTRISRQLLNDNGMGDTLVNWVIDRFARALGRAEDTAFMVGTGGSAQPSGIRSYSFTSIAQAGASLASTDLVNLVFTLPEEYRTDAVWIMPDSRIKLVANLRDTTGKQLYAEAFNNGRDVPTLMGYPVLSQPDIPTNLGAGTNESEIYFGDLSYYIIGDTEQTFAETSIHEGTSFERHRLAVKVGERLDAGLALTAAIVKMTAVK